MNAVCCYEPGWAVLEDGVTPFRVTRARLLGGRKPCLQIYKRLDGFAWSCDFTVALRLGKD